MKSRNLYSTALAAILVGSVVLVPAFASAQSRDRDDNRNDQRSQSSDRNYSRDSNRSSRSSNDRSSRQTVHLRGGYMGDTQSRSSSNWGNRSSGSNWGSRSGSTGWNSGGSLWTNRSSSNSRDRDDNRWNDNRDRDDSRNRDRDDYRSSRRVYVSPDYGYNGGYGYGYGYSAPYYGNSYGYSNGDDWRSIAEVAGLLSVIGILEHDDTLAFAGGAGALYSIYRYDEDRRSDDPACRLRAEYFSHPYFYRNGRRYDRVTVNRHGQEYYQFVCR